jgi:hypothetical protein
VDIQSLHSIRYPPPEAAVSQPEVQEAKVSKLKMTSEVEGILDKVDNVMGKMIDPADDNVDMFIRLSNVKDDALASILCFNLLVYEYEDEIDATQQQKLEGKISKMLANLEAYKLDMNAKMSALQQPRDKDPDIYNKRMFEKCRLFMNKNRNVVPEEKPEESIPEVDDLAEGQASHGAAKNTKMRTDVQACVPPAFPPPSPACPEPGSA